MDGEMTECSECGGTGEVTCETCGQWTDCEACDGTGEVEDN